MPNYSYSLSIHPTPKYPYVSNTFLHQIVYEWEIIEPFRPTARDLY